MSLLSLKQQDQSQYDSTRINQITFFRSEDSLSALGPDTSHSMEQDGISAFATCDSADFG